MRFWAIITIVVLFSSCSVFSDKPRDLIDEEILVDVLVDVHMADAIIAIKGFRIIQDSTTINLYYDDIMKKHNISRKQLDRTLEYYSKKVSKYDKIYDEVLEILSKKQKQCTEEQNKPENDKELNKTSENKKDAK